MSPVFHGTLVAQCLIPIWPPTLKTVIWCLPQIRLPWSNANMTTTTENL
jgi:hypothetical protein